jgi:CDP-diacylglycerol--glycerol-3-phosphate 3-phosphatidyltransferase
MKKHIPNFLTLLRVCMVPLFVWLAFSSLDAGLLWAFVVFVAASITDYFDGMLARRMNVISNFGKIMDPLADKLLVSAALIMLYARLHYISLAVVIIILARELLISLLREHFARRRVYIAAGIWGKLKTLLQMVGIIAAMAYTVIWGLFTNFLHHAFEIYYWLVVAVTLYSGWGYLAAWVKKK